MKEKIFFRRKKIGCLESTHYESCVSCHVSNDVQYSLSIFRQLARLFSGMTRHLLLWILIQAPCLTSYLNSIESGLVTAGQGDFVVSSFLWIFDGSRQQ